MFKAKHQIYSNRWPPTENNPTSKWLKDVEADIAKNDIERKPDKAKTFTITNNRTSYVCPMTFSHPKVNCDGWRINLQRARANGPEIYSGAGVSSSFQYIPSSRERQACDKTSQSFQSATTAAAIWQVIECPYKNN